MAPDKKETKRSGKSSEKKPEKKREKKPEPKPESSGSKIKKSVKKIVEEDIKEPFTSGGNLKEQSSSSRHQKQDKTDAFEFQQMRSALQPQSSVPNQDPQDYRDVDPRAKEAMYPGFGASVYQPAGDGIFSSGAEAGNELAGQGAGKAGAGPSSGADSAWGAAKDIFDAVSLVKHWRTLKEETQMQYLAEMEEPPLEPGLDKYGRCVMCKGKDIEHFKSKSGRKKTRCGNRRCKYEADEYEMTKKHKIARRDAGYPVSD